MGKIYTKAVAPKTWKIADYLTNGKAYDIIDRIHDLFVIVDDDGDKLYIGTSSSVYLNGQYWQFITDEETQPTQPNFDKSFIPFIVFTAMFLAAVAIWVVINWNH